VKYMLLMRGNGTSPDGETAARVCAAGWPAYAEQMRQVLVADGPFAETKEQVGGYQVIECSSRDDALYAAARHPLAQSGVLVELRPVADELNGG